MKRKLTITLLTTILLLSLITPAFAGDSLVLTEDDFSSQEFEVTVTRTCTLIPTWTVEFGGIDGHWHTGVQIVLSEDGETPTCQFGWNSQDTSAPFYMEYDGGWGPRESLPEGYTVSGSYNDDYYVLSAPVSGTFYWAMNVEASWPGHSSAVQSRFAGGHWSWGDIGFYRDQCDSGFVIPEVPLGTITSVLVMVGALTLYTRKPELPI